MFESEIMQKLMTMPTYSGVIDSNLEVIPFWDIGVDKVNLELFLKGAKKYHKTREKEGLLYVPVTMSVNSSEYYTKMKKLEKSITIIESKYPVRCTISHKSVEELISEHFHTELNK